MGKMLLYLLYGLVDGFSRFVPISASAHQRLFSLLLKFDSNDPLLCFFAHAGALGAVLLLSWKRVSHLYQEMRLVSLPPRRRNRPPDVDAVLDARLVMTAAIPALLGGLLSRLAGRLELGLVAMMLLLTVSGLAVYLPDYLPGGNRQARGMTPAEAAMLGLCAGISVIPGLSAMGLLLGLGLMRKCDRQYLLDIGLLVLGLMLGGMLVADLGAFALSGFAGLSAAHLLGCLLGAAAAFGGGMGAILTMRFLAVKTGFAAFAFYNWGLGMFLFILYLML